jgi:hypothetical protein
LDVACASIDLSGFSVADAEEPSVTALLQLLETEDSSVASLREANAKVRRRVKRLVAVLRSVHTIHDITIILAYRFLLCNDIISKYLSCY